MCAPSGTTSVRHLMLLPTHRATTAAPARPAGTEELRFLPTPVLLARRRRRRRAGQRQWTWSACRRCLRTSRRWLQSLGPGALCAHCKLSRRWHLWQQRWPPPAAEGRRCRSHQHCFAACLSGWGLRTSSWANS